LKISLQSFYGTSSIVVHITVELCRDGQRKGTEPAAEALPPEISRSPSSAAVVVTWILRSLPDKIEGPLHGLKSTTIEVAVLFTMLPELMAEQPFSRIVPRNLG